MKDRFGFKNFILLILGAAMTLLLLTACGAGLPTFIDTTWLYDEVMIAMPDGSVVSGKVETWCDYENSDQLQVKVNGDTYLTHASNVVLIDRKD